MKQNGITSTSPTSYMTASIGKCTNTVHSLLNQYIIKVNPPASTDSTCSLQYVLYYWTMNMMMNPMFSSYNVGNNSFATFIMSPTLQGTTNGVSVEQKSTEFINGYICALVTILYSGVICNASFTTEKEFPDINNSANSNLTAAAYQKYSIYNNYFNSEYVYSYKSSTKAKEKAKTDWINGYKQGCSTMYGYFKVQIYQPIPLYTTTTWILNTELSVTSPKWTTSNTLITRSGATLSYLEVVLDFKKYFFSSTNNDMIQIYDNNRYPLLSMTRCSYSINTSVNSTSNSSKTGVFNDTHTATINGSYTTRFLKISFYNVQYTSNSPSSYRLVVFTHYSADLTSTNFSSATNLMVYQRSVVPYMTILPITTPITVTYGVPPSNFTWVKTPCNPPYEDTSTNCSAVLNQLSCIYAV